MIQPSHFVAIFGGAVAGSEAAAILAERGIYTVVFDQHALPYGKIETGLPKWHDKLRDQEEKKINQKLKHPNVFFVPLVKLGRDISFEEITQEWGFSAVLLATGAWSDRRLPLENIDNYLYKGFYYQNPFVAWFNQAHDPNYQGPHIDIRDNAIVVGGGLASFDVLKILMIETTRLALEKKGHSVDILTLEKKGIAKILDSLNIKFEDLNLKGCTLYYRRRIIDMPLNSLPENPTKRDYEIAFRVREKIFQNMQNKYLFKMEECRTPVDIILKRDKIAGLKFRKTKVNNGNLSEIKNSDYEVNSPLIISAIGSIPEPIKGIPYENSVFKLIDEETGQIEGYDHVFALGNAVTGRGNIKESQLHGRRVSEKVMDEFLAWNEDDYQEVFDKQNKNVNEKVNLIGKHLQTKNLLATEKITEIMSRIKSLQKRNNFKGNYDTWIKKHLPIRIENMIPGERK
jgi:NADPH-dependent glutamate synthase beta subunit-like oxidoreductase